MTSLKKSRKGCSNQSTYIHAFSGPALFYCFVFKKNISGSNSGKKSITGDIDMIIIWKFENHHVTWWSSNQNQFSTMKLIFAQWSLNKSVTAATLLPPNQLLKWKVSSTSAIRQSYYWFIRCDSFWILILVFLIPTFQHKLSNPTTKIGKSKGGALYLVFLS